MIDTIIRFLYYSLFFFTPLIMASITSELFEFNKMLFIYSIAILVLFFWTLKMILHKKIILKKTPFDIPILLFLGSQVASTIFSIDKHTSLYGYYGRFNGGLLSIISYVILYFAFTSNFFNGEPIKVVKKLLKVSLLSSFLVILWGLPGKFGFDLSCFVFIGQLNNACWTDQFHPELRIFSTLGQPNWLGAYLAIHFFIGLYFLLQQLFIPPSYTEGKKNGTIILYGYLFLNFSSILFTRSRSALISVIGGFMLLLLFLTFYFKDNLKNMKTQVIQLSLILTCVIVPILLFKTGFQTVDYILNLSFMHKQKMPIQPSQSSGQKVLISESLDIRKVVWKGAIDLANRYPMFGSGVETFAYAYYFVRPIAHNMTSEWDYLYNKAHNEYLNYAATTGYIGLGTYLIMIGAFIFLAIRQISKIKNQRSKIHIKNQKEENNNETMEQSNNKNILMISLVLAYISILVTNFFGFSTTTINLFFYFIPCISMLALYAKPAKNHEPIPNTSLSLYQLIGIGLSGIIIIILLLSVLNYFLADVTYSKADAYSKTGDYQTSANLLTKALKLKYEHVYEDKLSYVLANLAVLASYQKQTKLAKDLQTLAENYNNKSIQASPKNVLYWKTRAKNEYLFYQISLNSSRIKEGKDALIEAQKLSPTDPKIPYSLSIFKSLLYDEEKDQRQKDEYKTQSLQDVEYSLKLKPDFRDGYFLKAQLLKKYGEKEKAKETYEYILKILNPSDEDVKKELQSL